jgi:hypothetical protein
MENTDNSEKTSEQINSDWNLKTCFQEMRMNKNYHLGLGDIRLTIDMQEEICRLVDNHYTKNSGQRQRI